MIALRRPVPLARLVPDSPASAFGIGFVCATLAFFAVALVALGLAAGRLAASWSAEVGDAATLHVFAAQDAVEDQALAALGVLRTTPGVRSVRIVEVEEQRALLDPWIDADLAVDALPMPLLIEVVADRDLLDRAALDARLAAEAPGAVFDDHADWRRPLIVAAARLRVFAFGSLALLGLALAAALGLAAAAAIGANGQAIRTLRLIGARDSFVSAAFTRRLTLQTACGASAGTALGLVLLVLLPDAGAAGLFPVGVEPVGLQWLALLAIPPVAAAVAWLAARIAAGCILRRWS